MNPEQEPQRCALIRQQGVPAGHLQSTEAGGWQFNYLESYHGLPVSLTMPVRREPYEFPGFPPVFDGLLPEGSQLEAILRRHKIDRNDSFRLLLTVGRDMVGSLTVEEALPAVPLTDSMSDESIPTASP